MPEQVKAKRLEMGLSQGEFGKLYGVSKNTVRRWENGSIKMSRKLWERIFKSGIG
ncbi:MAG: helix-turn-helix domain-containing protein [Ruminococcus sp.]|nr:helix-turn-helix domain-containing protein [Ruminococcus sp.]